MQQELVQMVSAVPHLGANPALNPLCLAYGDRSEHRTGPSGRHRGAPAHMLLSPPDNSSLGAGHPGGV